VQGRGQPAGVAGAELPGADPVSDQGPDPGPHPLGGGEGVAVEVGISEVGLEEGEGVGRPVRRSTEERGHAVREAEEGGHERAVPGAERREDVPVPGGHVSRHGQQEGALRPESLGHRGGRDARFGGHLGEGQAGRPASGHRTESRLQQVLVARLPGTRAHHPIIDDR